MKTAYCIKKPQEIVSVSFLTDITGKKIAKVYASGKSVPVTITKKTFDKQFELLPKE